MASRAIALAREYSAPISINGRRVVAPQKIGKEDSDKYCLSCRQYLDFVCEILGEVTYEKQVICRRAGYRDKKYSFSTARRYHNRQGDIYDHEFS